MHLKKNCSIKQLKNNNQLPLGMLYARKLIFMFIYAHNYFFPHLTGATFDFPLVHDPCHTKQKQAFIKSHQEKKGKRIAVVINKLRIFPFRRRMCFMSLKQPQKTYCFTLKWFAKYSRNSCFIQIRWTVWNNVNTAKSTMLRHIILITQSSKYTINEMVWWKFYRPSEVLFIVCDKQNNANLFIAQRTPMCKFCQRTTSIQRRLLHLFSTLVYSFSMLYGDKNVIYIWMKIMRR